MAETLERDGRGMNPFVTTIISLLKEFGRVENQISDMFSSPLHYWLSFQCRAFDESEACLEKGENAGNQHILLFPQCLVPFHEYFFEFGYLLK